MSAAGNASRATPCTDPRKASEGPGVSWYAALRSAIGNSTASTPRRCGGFGSWWRTPSPRRDACASGCTPPPEAFMPSDTRLLPSLVLVLILGIAIGLLVALLYIQQWKARYTQVIRQDAVQRSQAVTSGKVHEQLVPYLPEFGFNPKDARFLGSPVDLLVFDGLYDGALRRGIVLTDLAMVGVQRRDPDQVVEYADAALDTARQTGSGVIARKLQGLRVDLGPFLGDSRVRDVDKQIRALTLASVAR